jgi:hypothetical protein
VSLGEGLACSQLAEGPQPLSDQPVHPLSAPPGEPASGFWRVARPTGLGRTWLLDPDGLGVFVLGVNTVMRDTRQAGVPRCEGIVDYIRRVQPSRAAQLEWARLSNGRCGDVTVARPYRFNSIGAFSQINDFDDSGGDSYMIRPLEAGGAGAPYMVVLNVDPKGADRALADDNGTVLLGGPAGHMIGDPFNPAFARDIDAVVERQVVARAQDPRLQMWFAGNELGIFDKAERGRAGVRDFRRWLWSEVPRGSTIDRPRCARHALAAVVREWYADDIGALNSAWASDYPDFAAIVDTGPRPVPFVHHCNAVCAEDLQRFVHDQLLRAWVDVITRRVRAADQNHLLASPRLAISTPAQYRFWNGPDHPQPDHWVEPPAHRLGADTATVHYSPLDLLGREGASGFDLIAINAYTGAPSFARPWFTDGVHKLQREARLATIMSEFGVRARIRGWSNRGGAGAFVPSTDAIDDQLQRGRRYRSQIDQFIGFRDMVGAVWHAWSDRFSAEDPSLQINLGLVQCTDPPRGMNAGRRWDGPDRLIADTNRSILHSIAASTGF